MPVTTTILMKSLAGKKKAITLNFGGKMHCCIQLLLGTVREGDVKENFRIDSLPHLGLLHGIFSQICLQCERENELCSKPCWSVCQPGFGKSGLELENVNATVPTASAHQLSSDCFSVLLEKSKADKWFSPCYQSGEYPSLPGVQVTQLFQRCFLSQDSSCCSLK